MQKNIYLCDMEKEFVIYSLALRMKKLGYNGSCFAFYQVENFEEKPCGVDDRDEYIRTGFATCKNSEIPKHFTSAPTWQQAFMWLIPQIDGEFKVCLGENGWYAYNLENQIFEGDTTLEKLIEIVEQKQK